MTKFEDIRNVMHKIAPDQVFKLELIGRVKGIREHKGLSQSELSRLSGVPQKTISRMENGLSVPNMETMCKLLGAMNYQLNFTLSEKTTSHE